MTEQIPFDGDYNKALEAYKSLQSMYDKSKAETTSQVQSLQEQINQLSTKKEAPTTQSGADSGGGSLFDWYNGSMRTETGEVNPSLIAAMEKANAPKEVVDRMVQTIETAQGIVREQGKQIVAREAGSEENYKKLVEFAQANKSQAEVAKLNALIDDPDMAPYAIQRLKADYVAAGNSFDGPSTEQKTSNEPAPLQTPTGSGPGGITPLPPSGPDTARIVSEAYQSGDQNKINEVNQRLKAGMTKT